MNNISDIDCESILSKLILLTEQFQRVNELLELKQNRLKQRAINLHMRRLRHKYDMQKVWIRLIQIEANQLNELIGQATTTYAKLD